MLEKKNVYAQYIYMPEHVLVLDPMAFLSSILFFSLHSNKSTHSNYKNKNKHPRCPLNDASLSIFTPKLKDTSLCHSGTRLPSKKLEYIMGQETDLTNPQSAETLHIDPNGVT